MAFTKVAVIGAEGNLGKRFVESLLASTEPTFQVTVLDRPNSSYDAPKGAEVKVVQRDLTDQTALTEDLRGIDALIMMHTTNKEFLTISNAAIGAAIAAGVKMVMPSDFGSKDTAFFVKASTAKPLVRDLLQERANEGKITYTIVKNGPFFENPSKDAYGIDYRAKTATLYDDGTQKFNCTTFASIISAVIGILRSPAPYTNKTVYIHDFYTSQREMLAIIESEVNPDGSKFETTSIDTLELGKESLEAWQRDNQDVQNFLGVIKSAVWGPNGAADWDENDDSQALGLEKKDLRTELKRKMEMGL